MKNKEFCYKCRKDTEYELKIEKEEIQIGNQNFSFECTKAYCKKCENVMSLPGIIDLNIKERDRQYREIMGIISIEDIKNLTKMFKVSNEQLSLALGMEEWTLNRFLDGQVPLRKYSDTMKSILEHPLFMKRYLEENKDRITPETYTKCMNTIKALKKKKNKQEGNL